MNDGRHTQFKQLNASGTGQKSNTRVRTLYAKFKDRVKVAVMRYRAAYAALGVLQPPGDWTTRLRLPTRISRAPVTMTMMTCGLWVKVIVKFRGYEESGGRPLKRAAKSWIRRSSTSTWLSSGPKLTRVHNAGTRRWHSSKKRCDVSLRSSSGRQSGGVS